MGFLSKALITAAVGAGAALLFKVSAEEKEKKAEEERRKNTPCTFENGVTQEEFNIIVQKACKSVKRVSGFTVEGPVIQGVVRSQSGISEWTFTIDFNDYGNITGKYWITNENADSKIPSIISERIKESITTNSEGD